MDVAEIAVTAAKSYNVIMKKFLKTLWSILWPVVLYLLIAFVVEIIHSMVFVYKDYLTTGDFNMSEIMEKVTEQSLYSTGVVSIISCVIFVIIIIHDRKKHPKNTNKRRIRITVAALMAAVGACLTENVILSASGITQYDEAFNVINDIITGSPVFTQVLVAVILGPLTEELLFRGIIYSRVERNYGFWPGLIVSTLLFGALHGNFSQFIYAALLGVLFTYAYHISGSLILSVVMHMVANAASLVMDAITVAAEDPYKAEICLLVVGIGLLVCGMTVMVRKSRAELKKS